MSEVYIDIYINLEKKKKEKTKKEEIEKKVNFTRRRKLESKFLILILLSS